MIDHEKHIKYALDPQFFFEDMCGFDFSVDFQFLLESIEQGRYHLIMQRRGIGMTRFLACYCVWRMIFGLDENILIILSSQHARSLFHKNVSEAMGSIGPELMNGRTYNTYQDRFELGHNRAKLIIAGKSAGRGDMPSLVIFEDMTSMRDAKDIWMAVSFSMSMGQSDCIISNPWSTELGFFGDLWKPTIKGESDFTLHYL